MEPAAKPAEAQEAVEAQEEISAAVPDQAPGAAARRTGGWRDRLVPSFLRREKVLGQILRFGIVGVLNTLVDYGIFNLLHGVFGVPILIASPIGVAVGILNSFLWNKHWTFSAGRSAAWKREAAVFLVVSLIGLALNTLGLWVLNHIFGDTSLLAVNLQKLGASIISLTWNFLGYRYLTFRTHRSEV